MLRLVRISLALAVMGCGANVSPADRDATSRPDVAFDAPQRDAQSRPDAALDAQSRDVASLPDRVEPRDSSVCARINENTIRAPSVLIGAERAPLAATSASAGCGCALSAAALASQRYELRACDCSIDPCVDPNYVVNWDDDRAVSVTEPTREQIAIGTLRANVWRVPSNQFCNDATINSVMIEADNDARTFGPRRVWAWVRGSVQRCALEPYPHVSVRAGEPTMLTVRDCNNTDCDGPTHTVTFGVWAMLGTFAPGRHAIFFSPGVSQEFEVR